MPGAAQRLADGRDVGRHAGGRLVVDDEHGADVARVVTLEARLNLVGRYAGAVGQIESLQLDAEGGGGAGEATREEAVDAGEHAVARRQRVDDRRLPGARARAGVEEHVAALGLKDALEPVQALAHERFEARAAMVDDGLGHRAHDPIGDQRRPGDLQERPSGRRRHGVSLARVIQCPRP